MKQESLQLEAYTFRVWMSLCCIWCHQSYFNFKLIFYIVRLNIISVTNTPICNKAIASADTMVMCVTADNLSLTLERLIYYENDPQEASSDTGWIIFEKLDLSLFQKF